MGYFFIGEGIMLLSVFIVTFLMMRFLDRRPFSDLGFSLKGRGKDILYGFLMAVLIYAIGFGVCLLTGQIEVVSVHLHWSDLLLSGLFFAMVAIVEETMMRGYVLGRLLHTRLNKFISLLISSLLFALLHLMNPNVAFYPCSIWCWEGCYWELPIFTPVIFGFLFRFISFGTGFKGPYLAMKSVAIVSVKPCFHFACLQII